MLREGLRLIERRESEDEARLKRLREAARVGISDVEAGRFRDFGSDATLRAPIDELARRGCDRRRSVEQAASPVDSEVICLRSANSRDATLRGLRS